MRGPIIVVMCAAGAAGCASLACTLKDVCCERAIDYQANKVTVGPVTIPLDKTTKEVSLGKIEVAPQKLHEASDTIKQYDILQYATCQNLAALDRKDRLAYVKTRDAVMTDFSFTITALYQARTDAQFSAALAEGQRRLRVAKSASASPDNVIVLDFAQADTANEPARSIPAGAYLGRMGVVLDAVSPAGSRVVLVNNKGLYEGQAVYPTMSDNMLTQADTGNVPSYFTLQFREPLESVSFVRPRLFAATTSGVTHPAWKAIALDENGRELSSVTEGLTRSFATVEAQTYTLAAVGFQKIRAIRFESDPRLHGKPFAGFSALLIERITLVKQRS